MLLIRLRSRGLNWEGPGAVMKLNHKKALELEYTAKRTLVVSVHSRVCVIPMVHSKPYRFALVPSLPVGTKYWNVSLCVPKRTGHLCTWKRLYSSAQGEGKEREEVKEEGRDEETEKKKPQKPRSLLSKYLALSKARLSFLIVYTTVNGFLMAPVPIHFPTFLLTCLGTTLTVASANSINQYIEVDHDILMRRTANRPLPTGELSLNHALLFGISTGIAGTTMLGLGVNELAASLALGNILLYTLVYTPLKRVHWINTWVGAIVGAIPPLIGWAAATGDLSIGAFILGYTLLIWQIPHFLALSWSLKADYERAGYKMLVSSDPQKAVTLSYRYCFYFLPIPFAAVLSDMTTMPFAVEALILNFWLIYQGKQFQKTKSGTTSRRLFLTTLTYLFILLICFVIHKKAGYSIQSDPPITNEEEQTTTT